MSGFRKARRHQLRLRMAIDGPAKSGKSFTSLRCAFALAAHEAKKAGREIRVAAIDTENDSLSKYVGDSPDGILFDFAVKTFSTYAPTEYTAAIEEAGRDGFDVLVIDSLSHAWAGKDGALELKDRQDGNSFTAWKNITPMHNAMVESILRSPCHVICTMRSKTEFILEKVTDKNGRETAVPRKVGMAPIQRQGVEYEFDVYGSMDWSHIMTVSGSRCPSVDGAIVVKPGAAFMEPIIRWLETGERVEVAKPAPLIADEQLSKIMFLLGNLGYTVDQAKARLPARYGVTEFHQLSATSADDLLTNLERQWVIVQQEAQRKATASTNGAASPPTEPTKATEQPTSPPAETVPPVENKPAQPAPAPEPEHVPGASANAAPPPSSNGHATFPKSVTQDQLVKIDALLLSLGVDMDAAKSRLSERYGAGEFADLSEHQATDLIETLNKAT